MSHLLQRILSELILPPFGPFLLLWLGLLLVRRRPWLGYGIAIAATALLYVFSLTATHDWLRSPWPDVPRVVQPPYPPAQAIVVFGGGRYLDAPEYGGDTAAAGTLERVRYAAKLHRETGLPLLVSGGRPGDLGTLTEAAIMQGILEQEFGIPVRWLETTAQDTKQNAQRSARLLREDGVRVVLLVTDGYHAERAAAAFAGTGVEAVPMPTGFVRREPRNAGAWTPSLAGLLQNRYWLYEKLARFNPF